MLVDFTVKNFRSIRDEVTLSFFAESNTDYLSNAIHYPSSKKVGVLASAGIYGANASGKSTVLLALKVLSEFVSESHSLKEDEEIDYFQPFRLDELSKALPSEFAIEFVVEKTRYVYQVAFDSKSVISESLYFYSQGANREVRAKLFDKQDGASWEDISFGTYYKGGSRRFPLFKNQSYLSKAGNSPDAPVMIRKIYQFFRHGLIFPTKDWRTHGGMWRKNNELVKQASRFLSAVDTGVTDIVLKKENPEGLLESLPESFPEPLKAKIVEDFSTVPYFKHSSAEGSDELFAEKDESDGTRALFHILPLLLGVFKAGAILIWDELETSLHPHIAELVLDLFNNPQINKNNAQLLFTTHNVALMSSSKMRKDQLWITEKVNGVTQLSSLDEFDSSLKPSSPFAKWYYEGRLGGLPNINYNLISELFSSLNNDGKEDGETKEEK